VRPADTLLVPNRNRVCIRILIVPRTSGRGGEVGARGREKRRMTSGSANHVACIVATQSVNVHLAERLGEIRAKSVAAKRNGQLVHARHGIERDIARSTVFTMP